MTPLAHEIVADSTLPIRKRRHDAVCRNLRLLDEVHFFEVSEVIELAFDMATEFEKKAVAGRPIDETLAFLPAPRVFFEYRTPEGGRVGTLVEAPHNSAVARATIVEQIGNQITVGGPFDMHLRQVAPRLADTAEHRDAEICDDTLISAEGTIFALLAMINSPRIIGRRQHMPFPSLQRKVAAARGLPGKYPLQAWHELVLEVTPPRVDSGAPHEARLTGEKALHFVRSHLRIRAGRLEYVSAHWRGNPALGLKQTRYRVVPPRNRAA